MVALPSVLRAGGGQYILSELYNFCRQSARKRELNGVNTKQRNYRQAVRLPYITLLKAYTRFAYAVFKRQLCTIAFRLSETIKTSKQDGFVAKGLTLLQEFWIALSSLYFLSARRARK